MSIRPLNELPEDKIWDDIHVAHHSKVQMLKLLIDEVGKVEASIVLTASMLDKIVDRLNKIDERLNSLDTDILQLRTVDR